MGLLFRWWRSSRVVSRSPLRRRLRPVLEGLETRAQPATLSAPDLLTQSDTGASPFDNITRETRPYFAVTTTSPAGTNLYLTVDDVIEAAVVVPASGNTFTMQTTNALADGPHTVRAFDSSTGVFSAALAIQIDTAAPASPGLPMLTPESDSGAAGDRITSILNPTFTFAGEPAGRIILHVGSIDTTLPGSAMSHTVDATTLARNVPHDTWIEIEDAAGNRAASPIQTITFVDATTQTPNPPAIEARLELDPSSDTGPQENDGITSQSTLRFQGTGTPGASAVLYVDGVAAANTTIDAAGDFEFLVGPYAPGVYSFDVGVTPPGSPEEKSDVLVVTIDTEAPVISLGQVTPSLVSPNGDLLQDDSFVAVSMSEAAFVGIVFSDANGNPIGGLVLGVVDTATQLFQFDASAFPEGTIYYRVDALDAAGNNAVGVEGEFTIDVTPPEVGTLALAGVSDGHIPAGTVSWTGTTEPGSVVELVEGTQVLGNTLAGSNGTWSLDANFSAGTHSVAIQVWDMAGNRAMSSPVTVIADAPPPPPTPDPEVDSANDPPALAFPESAIVYRNQSIVFGSELNVSDPDNARLRVSLVADVGTLHLASTDGLLFAIGNDTPQITLDGPVEVVNSKLAELTYRPPVGYLGEVRIDLLVNDLGLGGSGGPRVDTGAIVLEVVNRPPEVLAPINFTMNANSTLTVPLATVLGTFADPDGDPLTLELVSPPHVGSLTVNADGSLTYTPPYGFSGVVSFEIVAFDGVEYSFPNLVTMTVKSSFAIRR